MSNWSDLLLLGGVALCVISVIAAIIQLLQTQPPRGAAITLVVGIVLIFGGAYCSPDPFKPQSFLAAWQRISGGDVAPSDADPTAPTEDAGSEETGDAAEAPVN